MSKRSSQISARDPQHPPPSVKQTLIKPDGLLDFGVSAKHPAGFRHTPSSRAKLPIKPNTKAYTRSGLTRSSMAGRLMKRYQILLLAPSALASARLGIPSKQTGRYHQLLEKIQRGRAEANGSVSVPGSAQNVLDLDAFHVVLLSKDGNELLASARVLLLQAESTSPKEVVADLGIRIRPRSVLEAFQHEVRFLIRDFEQEQQSFALVGGLFRTSQCNFQGVLISQLALALIKTLNPLRTVIAGLTRRNVNHMYKKMGATVMPLAKRPDSRFFCGIRSQSGEFLQLDRAGIERVWTPNLETMKDMILNTVALVPRGATL